MKKLSKDLSLKERMAIIEEEIYGEKVKHDMVVKTAEYPKAYVDYLRDGEKPQALKVGKDEEGGYLVPDEMEEGIIEAAKSKGVMRELATQIKTRNLLKIPAVEEHGTAAWIEEGEQLQFTDEKFRINEIDAHKVACLVRVTDELLEDSGLDIEAFIAKNGGEAVGEKEEAAFISGDGVIQPRGILLDAEVGVATQDVNMDAAIDLYFSVRQPYREKGVWLMSEDALRTLQKEKTANGRNAWEGNYTKELPLKLMGHRVYVSDAMPGIEMGNCPIAFGNFSFYWIGDRGNFSVKRLNELYADKGMVGFRITHRVDGRLMLPEAVKTLKIAS